MVVKPVVGASGVGAFRLVQKKTEEIVKIARGQEVILQVNQSINCPMILNSLDFRNSFQRYSLTVSIPSFTLMAPSVTQSESLTHLETFASKEYMVDSLNILNLKRWKLVKG